MRNDGGEWPPLEPRDDMELDDLIEVVDNPEQEAINRQIEIKHARQIERIKTNYFKVLALEEQAEFEHIKAPPLYLGQVRAQLKAWDELSRLTPKTDRYSI